MPNGNFATTKINGWLAGIGGYVSLHFDNPESAGYDESEVSGGGYARDTVTWTTASAKTIWNDNAIAFSGLIAGTITYLAGWDALTAGNEQWSALIPDGGWTVTTGAGILIPAHSIVLSFP